MFWHLKETLLGRGDTASPRGCCFLAKASTKKHVCDMKSNPKAGFFHQALDSTVLCFNHPSQRPSLQSRAHWSYSDHCLALLCLSAGNLSKGGSLNLSLPPYYLLTSRLPFPGGPARLARPLVYGSVPEPPLSPHLTDHFIKECGSVSRGCRVKRTHQDIIQEKLEQRFYDVNARKLSK